MNLKKAIAVGIATCALAAGVFFFILPKGAVSNIVDKATNALEHWCGNQLLEIAQANLGVDINFEAFNFKAVDTMQLTGVSLTDSGTEFVSCDSITVTFGAVPEIGEPVVISRLELEKPVLRFIQNQQGELTGWANLIESDGGSVNEDGSSTVLNDVFDLRKISIADGTIEYVPGDGSSAMRFEGISGDLDAQPSDEGWFAIKSTIKRQPVTELSIDGRINLNDYLLDLGNTKLTAMLSESEYELFPPAVQTFLTKHDIRGKLELELNGTIPLDNTAATQISAALTLSDSQIVFDEYILPIDTLVADLHFSSSVLDIKSMHANLLDGEASIRGSISLEKAGISNFAYQLNQVQIAKALKVGGNKEPEFAGKLNVNGTGETVLSSFADTIVTQGSLDITEGRLVSIPLFASVVEEAGGDSDETGSDTAEAKFAIAEDKPHEIRFTEIETTSGAIAVRGEGSVFFDSRIDFYFNGGPLERLQGLLGEIGDIFGKVTDQILKYHTTGTLSNPTTEVLPFGIDTG